MTAPVIITAGGTGGHVFPALAVAEALREADVLVVWMGTPHGLEARVAGNAGIPFEPVTVRALRGRGLRDTLTAPWMLLRALLQALAAVRRRSPRAVLGMGGYASGPGAIAAWLLRRPLIIHEQNAVAGMTNQRLARMAAQVLTGFDRPFPGAPAARFVGNPVRAAVAAVAPPQERLAGREGPVRVLVLGGSLGARALNETVPRVLAGLPGGVRPEVRHQAGERTLAVARQAYEQAEVDAEVMPFIEDMAAAYAWADLVICRAGALTVAELAAAGCAAVLVPYPYAVDDHQAANAAFLVDAGAAFMLREPELARGALERVLSELLGDRDRLRAMAVRAREKGRPDAARAVADVCLEVGA
ncbi:undecaprenyldiphospho-muramoylpentapeptide beta-N-acetylglucosaminyltransferase [Arhodomonas aquaeolei]|uniref:undecaprenyldiphospho-muramoylpentapeptide beta-N-acetylglucosaminyltransferase n=1 Tax=Arhodomonas aquaeolei TaxID=2369 RepID=UPI00037941E7|nr:undecaprenyldiphospho-muramoylpentapeptide beta-N-acetylglucosaminyltransferase [Arhodomonas aquaeolei]